MATAPGGIVLVAGILTDHLVGPEWLGIDPVSWWLIAVVATSAAMIAAEFWPHSDFGGCTSASGWCTWRDLASLPLEHRFGKRDRAVCAGSGHRLFVSRRLPQARCNHSPPAKANPLRAIPAESQSQLLVQVTRIRDGTSGITTNGMSRLRINGILREIEPGDRLLVFGQLGKSRPALNPGQYDYAASERIRRQDIASYSPVRLSA